MYDPQVSQSVLHGVRAHPVGAIFRQELKRLAPGPVKSLSYDTEGSGGRDGFRRHPLPANCIGQMVGTFLKAEWRHLAMFNYVLDRALLAPLVPYGTDLDEYEGETYCSIVAFLFLRTRVMGVAIPFHCNFEEVNLRFYVRRVEAGRVKRAVSFVQEVVPRRAITLLANALYQEHYRTARMSHRIGEVAGRTEAEFMWRVAGKQNRLSVTAEGEPKPLVEGSLDQFIAEHYWGYAAQRDGSSIEYAVNHPSWRVRPVSNYRLDVDYAGLYGKQFVDTLQRPPRSVFLAEGSAVTISHGRRIRA